MVMIMLGALVAAVWLIGFAIEMPAMAQSCKEQFAKCIEIAPTLGFQTPSMAASACQSKRMKCLHTGCWFINRQGTKRCGISKQ